MAYYNMSSDDDDYHSAPEEGTLGWIFQGNIGTGGFGVVKLFVNQQTGKKMVIKECRLMIVSGENLVRWNQELDLLKRLDHDNIVKAQNIPAGLDYHQTGVTPFICMEYCEGGDLRQVLRQPENCCGLSEEKIRQIFADVNSGIEFLHSEKVIHRDLKPENILIKLDGSGKVVYKLTDFGYAKTYDQSSVCTSMVGTAQYVAPEVLQNKPYNSSVDFWSFGVVVFECITGRRPFLHGDPSIIAWVDVVARKQPDVIHIYWGDHETNPVYSSTLPLPHQLSRPITCELTSWLKTALHFDPVMRGGRRVTTEDAPCLRNMERILITKVMNCICTSTGDVYSYEVDELEKIESLKRRIQSDTTVPSCDQYLVTPTGHMLRDSDLIGQFIPQNNLGTVYIFTTTFVPSFKMIHDPNDAVSKLVAYGDENINNSERRDIYANVYFHIREYYFFFTRLNQAHKAFLWQIKERCNEVRMLEQGLLNTFNIVKALAAFIKEMHSSDSEKLKAVHDFQQVLPPSVVSRTLHSWQGSFSKLEWRTEELGQLTNQIAAIRKETETYLQLAEERREANVANMHRVAKYCDEFVVKACDVYREVKNSKGSATGERMQDILLGAMADAQEIIERNFNGVSFGENYVALGQLCQSLSNQCEKLEATKEEIKIINDRRREDLWNLLQHDRKNISNPFSPSSPGNFQLGQPRPHTSSSNSQSSSTYSTEHPTNRRGYSHEFGTQLSNVSYGSVEEEEALKESLKRFERSVSQDANDKVMERSRRLMRRLTSIQTEVHHLAAPNGYPQPSKTHTH